jgi:crotonobetainyl-CoA:carnitine CoA-transferase CaiB-like acyl-CoA transferase
LESSARALRFLSCRAPLIGEPNAEVFAELDEKLAEYSKKRTQKTSSRESIKPLEGLKVVDFGWNITAPLLNAAAILAALDFRRRTGKGLYLDMSQLENGIHFLSPLILDYGVNGHVADRMGNRHPQAAPHGAAVRGEDRWCAIAVFTEVEWQGFCSAIGSPVWTRDERFCTLENRKANEAELENLIETWTLHYSPRQNEGQGFCPKSFMFLGNAGVGQDHDRTGCSNRNDGSRSQHFRFAR